MSIYKDAYDLSKQAADEGFDWDHWTGAFDKVAEELEEVRQEALVSKVRPHSAMVEEFGDLIFSIMSLARHLTIDPEEACQIGAQKFEKRFREYKLFTQSKGVNIKTSKEETLKKLWDEYKETLKTGS